MVVVNGDKEKGMTINIKLKERKETREKISTKVGIYCTSAKHLIHTKFYDPFIQKTRNIEVWAHKPNTE